MVGIVCFATGRQVECEIVIIGGAYYARLPKTGQQVPVVPHANLKGFYVEVPF